MILLENEWLLNGLIDFLLSVRDNLWTVLLSKCNDVPLNK
jgi:hypothetical protein